MGYLVSRDDESVAALERGLQQVQSRIEQGVRHDWGTEKPSSDGFYGHHPHALKFVQISKKQAAVYC
eukprot:6188434-Pleurochrysis_carterae.AAC.1